jgi:hypothetical protein
MKHFFAFAAPLLLLFTFASCTHKGADNKYVISGDYMIIGHPGGFTTRLTDIYYIISDGQLRADTAVPYGGGPDDINKFNFSVVMPVAKYDAVKNVPASIPSELLSRNNQTIGSYIPDVGYTDVRTSVNGTAYKWSFAADQSASSPAIQQFLDSVAVVFKP